MKGDRMIRDEIEGKDERVELEEVGEWKGQKKNE